MSPQQTLALQAHAISLRLVQSVAQLNAAGMTVPSGPGVGNQVNVLGTSYVPSWAGINGPRGFTDGSFTLQLYQEGAFTLNFPNAEGEDGLLHRRRFLILNTGKLTPKGGNVADYAGGAFRPGDEYLEIYRNTASGAPGKLMMVCAVTKCTIDGGTITLEGNDALWLLKKTRETTAGFLTLGPRDYIDHYTRTKAVAIADDFPNDARFPFNVRGGQYSTDNNWYYYNASNVAGNRVGWSTGLGTVVRLLPGGALQQLNNPAPYASGFSTFAPSVRWETRLRSSYSNATSTATYITVGAGPFYFQLAPNGNYFAGLAFAPNFTALAGQVSGTIANLTPNGWHSVSWEFRDKFVYLTFDGTIIAILPQIGYGDYTGAAYSTHGLTISALLAPLDVDYVVQRFLQPTFLRSADPTKYGDYQLGGLPAPGSVQLQVWRIEDIQAKPFNTIAGIAFSPSVGLEFAPNRIQSRVSVGTAPAPIFPVSDPSAAIIYPSWWPSGAGIWNNGGWAARAMGSIYLTLGTYDYRFAVWSDDAARLWVGKTRMGEQLIDNWQWSGHTLSLFVSPYLKASSIASTTLANYLAAGNGNGAAIIPSTFPAGMAAGQLLSLDVGSNQEVAAIGSTISQSVSNPVGYYMIPGLGGSGTIPMRAHSAGALIRILNQGSLAGQPTGWYPLLFEFMNMTGLGAGGAVMLYERSDQPGWWAAVGASAYIHSVYSLLSQAYMAGAGFSSGAFYLPLNQGGPTMAAETIQGLTVTAYSAGGTVNYQGNTTTTMTGDSAPLLNGGFVAGRTGDYLLMPTVPTPTSAFTISCLCRPDILTGSQQTIFRKENAWCFVILAGGAFTFYGANSGGFVGATGTAATAGQWAHLVGTFDGQTLSIYINGVLSGTTEMTGQVTNGNQIYVGNASDLTESFSGPVHHCFMSHGAMTPVDVATLYAAITSPPHMPTSSTGIIDTTSQPTRLESHYDQVTQTVTTWGLQMTTEPMQLESGEFPGRLRPLGRVGRDTEYIVGSPQVLNATASDIKDEITAEEVADILASDAQGIADPTNSAQLVAELFAFANIGPAAVSGHPWVSEEYDQQNSISVLEQLLQRLSSEILLRGSPWENVSMSHRPESQLVDTFPLTGSASEFLWTPGDGVRLNFPELGVVDQSTRQVLTVQWPVTPAGLGAPSIGLRQRPRSLPTMLRNLYRNQLSASRSFQGQLTSTSGNVGGYPNYSDQYTNVNLPANLGTVVTATLNVQTLTGGTWTLEVNDVAVPGISISQPGRYDLSSSVAKLSGQPWMYARLINTSGAYSASYQIEILYAIGTS